VFGAEHLSLAPSLSAEIRTFIRRARVTLYMFFVAVYAVVLRSYTGRKLVPIWAHSLNRHLPEIQRTIGFFATTHMLGVDLSEEPTVRGLLDQVRRETLEAVPHFDVPIGLLWHSLGCAPRYPDLKVLIDVLGEELPRMEAGGLRISSAQLPDWAGTRVSECGVYVLDTPNGISLTARFPQELFEASGLQEMLQRIRTISEQFLMKPDTHVSTLIEELQTPSKTPPTGTDEMSEFILLDSSLIASLPHRTQETTNSKDSENIQGTSARGGSTKSF
jgi:hypothetical protein